MQTVFDYLLIFGAIGVSAAISTAVLLFILRVQSNRRKGKHVKSTRYHTARLGKFSRKKEEPLFAAIKPELESKSGIEIVEAGEAIPESREKIHGVIGVIGTRRYRNKDIMFKTLNDLFGERDKSNIVFITGDASGPDEWLVEWAKEHGFTYDVYEVQKEETVFDRNGRIATSANAIVAFVPKELYKTGTRNCISQFRKMGKSLYLVFDQFGDKWEWDWKDNE